MTDEEDHELAAAIDQVFTDNRDELAERIETLNRLSAYHRRSARLSFVSALVLVLGAVLYDVDSRTWPVLVIGWAMTVWMVVRTVRSLRVDRTLGISPWPWSQR